MLLMNSQAFSSIFFLLTDNDNKLFKFLKVPDMVSSSIEPPPPF
jgi:hypothetical protein